MGEALRDFLFALRYSAQLQLVRPRRLAMSNVVAYGPAISMTEEGLAAR